jgi:hypothetical protein
MEAFANVLGAFISEGLLDSFHLPAELVKRVKELAPRPGEWKNVGWLAECFEEISNHDELLPPDDPLRSWPDHMYRIALYMRYFDAHKLGYSPHFLQEQGYQLYSLLEATDMAAYGLTGETPDVPTRKYAQTMGGDKVLVSCLSAFLKPRLSVLSDEDLASIRDEGLFENWRVVVRDSLKAVREHEMYAGQQQPNAVAEEVRERYEKWRADSKARLRGTPLETLFDIAKGAAVSVITRIAIGDLESVASLSLGAAYTILESVGRTFTWRKSEKVFNRHFLSIT